MLSFNLTRLPNTQANI